MTTLDFNKNTGAGANANRHYQSEKRGGLTALRHQQHTLKKIMHYFQGDYLYTDSEDIS